MIKYQYVVTFIDDRFGIEDNASIEGTCFEDFYKKFCKKYKNCEILSVVRV